LVSNNLAEGCGRSGLLNAEEYTDLAAQASEVKRMLTGLWQTLTADS